MNIVLCRLNMILLGIIIICHKTYKSDEKNKHKNTVVITY